jgi:hypothetical protein
MTENKGPQMAKGKRRVASIPMIYKGAHMRSLFEVEFAKLLDQREIKWEYEPERLQGGQYLVDFYLPDLKCWVEVKGRFEARDKLLLPLVGSLLKHERGERLFLYMKRRAYRISAANFEELTQEEFWEDVTHPPEDKLLRRPKRDPGSMRRPWQK